MHSDIIRRQSKYIIITKHEIYALKKEPYRAFLFRVLPVLQIKIPSGENITLGYILDNYTLSLVVLKWAKHIFTRVEMNHWTQH